jgi:tetratricopeptide (TPR) repeat protein
MRREPTVSPDPALRRIAAVAAVLAAVLCLVPGAARAEGEDVAACEKLLAEGRVAEAVTCFRALADATGGDRPEVQSGLGRALLRAGKPRTALEPLRRAATARGTPADHAVLAEALVGSAEERMQAGPSRTIDVVPFLKDAIVAAEEAAKDPAQVRPATLAKARAHFLLGELDAARAALDLPALASDPTALDLRGRVEYAGKRWAEAAAAFDAAGNRRAAATAWYAAKDPRVVDAYMALLAETPGDLALLEEAVGAARAASAAGALEAALGKGSPPDAAKGEWLYARGRLLESAGRGADAIARYREAADAMPGDVRPRAHVARLLWAAAPDDPAALADAERLLLEALKLSPKDPDVRMLLGAVAARLGSTPGRAWPDRSGLDRAISIYRALGEADPDDAEAWANAGNGLRWAGDPEASLEAYDRAVAANPHDALVWNDRGLAELAAGKDDAALASFARAAAVGPSELSPRQNAGRILWLRGDLDAAAAQYREALRVARAAGGSPMLFRFLLDRVERTRATRR